MDVKDGKKPNYLLRGGIVLVLLLLGLLEIRMAYFAPAEDPSGGTAEERTFAYRLGDTLSFAEEATGNPYCVEGLYENEGTHTWTSGNAKMTFDLEGEYEDLLLEFSYTVYAPPQRVYVFAGGSEVGNFTAAEDGTASIPIPGDLVGNGRLQLELVFPDAVTPKSRGESDDLRLLSLGMLDLRISNAARTEG